MRRLQAEAAAKGEGPGTQLQAWGVPALLALFSFLPSRTRRRDISVIYLFCCFL